MIRTILLVLLPLQVLAITTKIVAQTEECFHETAPPGGSISVAFAVTHGGKLDIDAVAKSIRADPEDPIYGVKEDIIQEWKAVSEGHAEFKIPSVHTQKSPDGTMFVAPTEADKFPGRLTICFSNKMARWTPKWINFEFYKLSAEKGRENDDGMTGDHNLQYRNMEQLLHTKANQVYEMRQKMQKLRTVEQQHRDTVESTNSWVFYGSVADCFLLCIMAVFQFWYLRRFLSVRAGTRTV